MKRLVWEFLNTKYKNVVIYREVHNLVDSRMEKFIGDTFIENIVQFTYYHSGKEIRTRVNSFIRGDIKSYFGIEYIDIEMYVLEWARNKTSYTIEL